MRFLASDQERKSEDATEYLSKCEDYIGGMSAFVSNIEGALKRVQRDSIVRKEAVRSEVRRLMQELDRERNTTRKLSLTVDQKNQKIHELTQALKNRAGASCVPYPAPPKRRAFSHPLNGGPRDASPCPGSPGWCHHLRILLSILTGYRGGMLLAQKGMFLTLTVT